jgi:aerobic-type carbon monoxide dehydrogenase small subunit (CoxS/CutS family)
VQETFVGANAFRHSHCAPGFIMVATKWLDEHSDPDDETIKHYLSRCAACREVLEAVKSGTRKRMASASGTARGSREGPRS